MADPTELKSTTPSSSFPALCLILSIFFIVFAEMLLCHCPGVFMTSALFAALALWRGTGRIRIASVILTLLASAGAVASIIAEKKMKARVLENGRKFQERQASLASAEITPTDFPHWRDPKLPLEKRAQLARALVPANSTFAEVTARLGHDGTLTRYHGVQIDLTKGTNSPANTGRDFQQWQYEYKFEGGAVVVHFEDKTKLPQPETRVTSISYSTTLETKPAPAAPFQPSANSAPTAPNNP